MSKITVVDLGNMNIKYKGCKASGSFSSRISIDYQAYSEGLKRIELDSKVTYIGMGELSREFNKVERNWLPQLLYAICKANPDEISIETNLTLLLPALQMDNKGKLIEKLKFKDFKFKQDGKDRTVKIKELIVLPEGFATFYSLDESTQDEDVLILDLGSRTTNICGMVAGEIEILQTAKIGSFDFYNKIRSKENAKGNDYNEETVQRCILNGIIQVTNAEYEGFLREVLDVVKGYANLKTYNKVIFTGGCSLMLKDHINKLANGIYKLHDNALTSNVDGAYEASKLAWSAAA